MNSDEKSYEKWLAGLPAEVDFWDRFLADEIIPWQEERIARLSPNTPFQDWLKPFISVPAQELARILDVGAGPATKLGSSWPGHQIEITAIDPLANQYNEVLQRLGIIPPVRTQPGEGEHLVELLGSAVYDFAISINALDHAYNPVKVIQELVEVVKPGAWIVLMHATNEAEYEGYSGLHQWNFCQEDDEFVIWNKDKRLIVNDHLPHNIQLRLRTVEMRSAGDGIGVFLRRPNASDGAENESMPSKQFESAMAVLEHNELGGVRTLSQGQAAQLTARQVVIEQQNTMLAELRQWGADLQAEIGRQQTEMARLLHVIEELHGMLAELRQWGADLQAEISRLTSLSVQHEQAPEQA